MNNEQTPNQEGFFMSVDDIVKNIESFRVPDDATVTIGDLKRIMKLVDEGEYSKAGCFSFDMSHCGE